ncbi:hypothetical protein RhiirA4_463619 [Rhizophagus irregularis]|uniref:FAR1 domain-containing protein n=2 Tax=Rhizophagus irregularis TaxID=588596 RepID=A0A2I1GNB8_9GLOM|nr:hypothetical protein RhiirA4_463619 [Rhizophagus irregularis]
MENIVLNTNFSYNNLYDSSDPLFNSYYDSSYNDSDLLSNSRHNSSVDTFNPLFNFSYDFSDLFLENDEIANEIQIGNESLVDFLKDHMKDRQKDNNEIQLGNDIIGNYLDDHQEENRNESINTVRNHSENYHHEEEYDDSEYESEYESEEENGLELNQGKEFSSWELAESYLDEYAKQQGFCLRKKRRIPDPNDNTITRRRTYECSHAQTHETQKTILVENRRDRDSEMIGCSWHINLAFPKSSNGVRINSIIGKHNHDMNPLVGEIAPKYRKLTDKMIEKVKFWTIQGKMGISTQYNLLVALFPDKVINKKDLKRN